MYALIPQEMLAAGSWLTPTLNGAPYLDKPHLLYWLNMLGYKLLGVSAWSARVPTLLITVGEVWLTYLIGRRLVGRFAAWLGGFILLTCIGFFVLHLLILTDHLVTLSLLAALYALLRWEAQPGFRWTALFFLALVAGFLSKGFIGVVFPGVIGLLYAWQVRERRLLQPVFSPGGLALAAILLVAWGVATELANPGFLKFQIVNEQIMRFLGRRNPSGRQLLHPCRVLCVSGHLADALDLHPAGSPLPFLAGHPPRPGSGGRRGGCCSSGLRSSWAFSPCRPAASNIIPCRPCRPWP